MTKNITQKPHILKNPAIHILSRDYFIVLQGMAGKSTYQITDLLNEHGLKTNRETVRKVLHREGVIGND